MKKINKQKGITLVALVITIIILLILAGISIQTLKNQGLLGQAKKAKETTEEKAAEENETLENYMAQIDKSITECKVEPLTIKEHAATEILYSWDEIASIAQTISNNNSINENTVEVKVTLNEKTKILGVGDTKTLDGKQVRILGFNHDTLTNPTAYGTKTLTGTAGISFEYVEFLTTAQMNSNRDNSGGWESSELRRLLNGDTYNSLINKYNIKQVNKEYISTYYDASTKTTCSDYLWLLSCGEIWNNGYGGGNTRGYAVTTEGKQYEYYKLKLGITGYRTNSDITKKPNINSSNWWFLRSPYNGGSVYYCYVHSDGFCEGCYVNDTHGVAPGFSI